MANVPKDLLRYLMATTSEIDSDIIVDSEGYFSDADEDSSRRTSQKMISSEAAVKSDTIKKIKDMNTMKSKEASLRQIDNKTQDLKLDLSRRNSRGSPVNYTESPKHQKPIWETDAYKIKKERRTDVGCEEIESDVSVNIYNRNNRRNSRGQKICYTESPEKAPAPWETRSKSTTGKIKQIIYHESDCNQKKEKLLKENDVCDSDSDRIIEKKMKVIHDSSSDDSDCEASSDVVDMCMSGSGQIAELATENTTIDQAIIVIGNDSTILGKCPFYCSNSVKLPHSTHLASLLDYHNDLKRRFELGIVVKDAIVSSQHRICEYHSAEITLLPQWIAKGYPLTIDFKKIKFRLSKCIHRLRSIYNGDVHSIFKKNIIESIQAKHSLDHHMGKNGYYGWVIEFNIEWVKQSARVFADAVFVPILLWS
jgi:hypothetical protein